MTDKCEHLTKLLDESKAKPHAEVAAKMFPIVYDELRALAKNYLRAERKGHTLQPTALVHEAFLRLVDQSRVDWQGRTHFYAVGAQAMKRVLVDHARAHRRAKRSGGFQRVMLDETIVPQSIADVSAIELSDTLESLAALDPQQARIVELRFFAGMTVEEVAHVLGVSKRTVEADWTHAKAWLRTKLDAGSAQ